MDNRDIKTMVEAFDQYIHHALENSRYNRKVVRFYLNLIHNTTLDGSMMKMIQSIVKLENRSYNYVVERAKEYYAKSQSVQSALYTSKKYSDYFLAIYTLTLFFTVIFVNYGSSSKYQTSVKNYKNILSSLNQIFIELVLEGKITDAEYVILDSRLLAARSMVVNRGDDDIAHEVHDVYLLETEDCNKYTGTLECLSKLVNEGVIDPFEALQYVSKLLGSSNTHYIMARLLGRASLLGQSTIKSEYVNKHPLHTSVEEIIQMAYAKVSNLLVFKNVSNDSLLKMLLSVKRSDHEAVDIVLTVLNYAIRYGLKESVNKTEFELWLKTTFRYYNFPDPYRLTINTLISSLLK